MEDIFTPEEKDAILKECENTSIEYFFAPVVGGEEQYAKKKAILRLYNADKYLCIFFNFMCA